MLRIFGIDFTSAPSNRKPITVAHAELEAHSLTISRVDRLSNWEDFEALLALPGPWRAGFDFPFSQPLELFEDFGLSGTWLDLVHGLTSEGRDAFETRLRDYKRTQPTGKKHHFRETDRASKSCSPMTLEFTPVGKMFFEGAPRLCRAGISVLPCNPTSDTRSAVEAYPRLVAQKCVGSDSYKADNKRKQTHQQHKVRKQILDTIGEVASQQYEISLKLTNELGEFAVTDATGDTLDSILCAVQAAWSANCRDPLNGIPARADRREGWIVDPSLTEFSHTKKR